MSIDVEWSLVTVTFNSRRDLVEFWSERSPGDAEWIVIDNNSTDDSVRVAESLGARVVKLPRNVGFSAANNVGLGLAQGRNIAFVNPDIRVSVETLQQLATVLAKTDALVSPQLFGRDGAPQPNGRSYPFLWSKIWSRLRPHGSRYLLMARGADELPVSWFIGAFVGGRRDSLEKLGGWDPRFFIYYEDKDICLRARRAGMKVFLVGSTRATHGWARATTSFSLTAWRHEIRSMRRFYSLYPRFLLPPWRRVVTAVDRFE